MLLGQKTLEDSNLQQMSEKDSNYSDQKDTN